MRAQAGVTGARQERGGLVGGHPELAAERGGRAGVVGAEPHRHGGAGSEAGEEVDVGRGVGGEAGDAGGHGGPDVGGLLHGVAPAHPRGCDPGEQAGVELADAGEVDARAHLGEEREDLGMGIRLDGVGGLGFRQGVTERGEGPGDRAEVQLQSGTGHHPFVGAGGRVDDTAVRPRGPLCTHGSHRARCGPPEMHETADRRRIGRVAFRISGPVGRSWRVGERVGQVCLRAP